MKHDGGARIFIAEINTKWIVVVVVVVVVVVIVIVVIDVVCKKGPGKPELSHLQSAMTNITDVE